MVNNRYKEYLKSEHWKLLSGAKRQSSPSCERCGSKDELEIHHKFYRKTWLESQITDLETLCHGCHAEHHAKQVSRKTMSPKQIAKACKKPLVKPVPTHQSVVKKTLPSIEIITWQNKEKFNVSKASYAWMKAKGLYPDKAGWRSRIVGHACPASFLS